MPAHQNLMIVSNRLPITIKRLNNGDYEFSQSPGGLAGALGGLAKALPFLWFGWPGLEIPKEDEALVRQKVAEHKVLPIFLDCDLANKYYNGFSSQFSHPTFDGRCHGSPENAELQQESPGKLVDYLSRFHFVATFSLSTA